MADKKKYKYRGFPSNVVPMESLWSVNGKLIENGKLVGGGILEWCVSEEDARVILEKMEKFQDQFEDLHIGKYRE